MEHTSTCVGLIDEGVQLFGAWGSAANTFYFYHGFLTIGIRGPHIQQIYSKSFAVIAMTFHSNFKIRCASKEVPQESVNGLGSSPCICKYLIKFFSVEDCRQRMRAQSSQSFSLLLVREPTALCYIVWVFTLWVMSRSREATTILPFLMARRILKLFW